MDDRTESLEFQQQCIDEVLVAHRYRHDQFAHDLTIFVILFMERLERRNIGFEALLNSLDSEDDEIIEILCEFKCKILQLENHFLFKNYLNLGDDSHES